ncbi:MAG: 23S rRNA (uracil(1939)-C(5))-methyltransferase RlmD [Odoribacteraceae bacterium]|jgi:23S rRNA (uracil1939-C5)-methyltransferase|nr:23S rRNA (uracil(1939)-C(5))-methyltransferase RlmD [Odoribacteraceae bacterium]
MKKPLLEGIEIVKVAAGGKAIGYTGEKVVFVPGTVPGDVVDVQVTRSRSRFMEGFVVRTRVLSPGRVTPFCAHFGTCGGCCWQNMPYEAQLAFKQQEVEDALRRVGHAELPAIDPIIGSARTREYRNKLEFTFSDRRFLTREEVESGVAVGPSPALGFHAPGLFDKVVDVEWCHLQGEPSNAIRNFTRRLAMERGASFYSARERRGLLRGLIVRTSTTGEVMVIVVFGEDDRGGREAVLEGIRREFPSIASLQFAVNEKGNDSVSDLEMVTFAGEPCIFEEMEGLRFRVGPKSFYQTNPVQARELYRRAREMAGLTGKELVYDLYTGTGTIALFAAAGARRVVGVEYVQEAIDDARVNARMNGVDNATFIAGDMKEVLSGGLLDAHGRPDVVITDPPRAGMHPAVVEAIARAGARRVVYVSCNPATQARDVGLMLEGYRVAAVQPVDMFPQTHHVENIVLLERRD